MLHHSLVHCSHVPGIQRADVYVIHTCIQAYRHEIASTSIEKSRQSYAGHDARKANKIEAANEDLLHDTVVDESIKRGHGDVEIKQARVIRKVSHNVSQARQSA